MRLCKPYLGVLLALLLLSACAKQAYVAKPIDTKTSEAKLAQQHTGSKSFESFLLSRGYAQSDLPIKKWSLDTLTLSAIYHHKAIDVAKAQWNLAVLDVKTAGLKPGISIGGNLARSNQKNGDIRPWAYGLALNIPIITNNKQDIKIEKAQYNVEMAQLNIAQTAWGLRIKLSHDLLALNEALASVRTLEKLVATHQKLVAQYEKLMRHGFASSVQVSKAKLDLQKHNIQLAQAKTTIKPLLTQIAIDAGVPYQSFSISDLTLENNDKLLNNNEIKLKKYQQAMLMNRLDIRQSLVQYAMAESDIKLEVAKQTPDITLSPGVIFEFGDTVWSLGIDTLLSSLKRNQHLIARAEQLRAVEAANFEALQAQRIGELITAYAEYEKQKTQHQLQVNNVSAEKVYFAKLKKQFDAGLIDRLALIQAQLNVDTSEMQRSKAKYAMMTAMQNLENLLQIPADVAHPWFDFTWQAGVDTRNGQ